MTNYRVNVYALFGNHQAFPWDVLGYGVPQWGPVHSYVSTILAPLAHRIEKPLLEGKPTLRELGRMADAIEYARNNNQLQLTQNDPPFVSSDIFKHCEHLYGQSKSDRTTLAQEVLSCLRRFQFYKDFLQKRLDYLRSQGLISVPMAYLEAIEEPRKDNPSNYGW